jgi:hypothetical protein
MRSVPRKKEVEAQQNKICKQPLRNRHGKPGAEQRKGERMVAGRTGWIAFQKMATLRKCFVDNESHNGAQLVLDWAVDLPDFFYLYFSSHFLWRRYCRVAWRYGDKVGIELSP